jgi:hypothetical protein
MLIAMLESVTEQIVFATAHLFRLIAMLVSVTEQAVFAVSSPV